MVIRPNGYSIWENIQKNLDTMLKQLGVENAYFPIFIPLSLLQKEADHIEGFSPELAIVTHGGGQELEEKLAVRPTSETIMYSMYSKWIQSYRDLPLLLNQWNNVVRWEKRTYFFLRTAEFLWQEAHTAHASHANAMEMVLDGLEAYRKLSEEFLAIPVIKGRKSNLEKFAGANLTTAIEALMPDGKALQAGTSHDLGQNFSQPSAFDISFQNENGQTDYVWQTSYGLSTRIIGAIILAHGDDDGLVLPPKISPTQIFIIPTEDKTQVHRHCEKMSKALQKAHIRTKILANKNHTLGWKLHEAEIQGVPVTIVIGPQELASQQATVKVRHSKQASQIPFKNLPKSMNQLLDTIQSEMYAKAQERQEKLTTETNDYQEFQHIMQTTRGFIKSFWCENDQCELEIKEQTKATTRVLPFIDDQGHVLEESGQCIKCGQPATHRWIFAQAY